jgi:hypothetical protein
MTSLERNKSIHPTKQVAALKAQIDNFEFEVSKIPRRKRGQGKNEDRSYFVHYIFDLKKKLKIAEQESNKAIIFERQKLNKTMVIEK